MGNGCPAGIISGSLDLEAEGSAVGPGGGDQEAQAGLAADGVIELILGAEAVTGRAKEPAGTATKGQLVAVPAQAAWAQADHSVERRTQGLDGCALPPGRYSPGQREAGPPLPGRKRVFLDRPQGGLVGLQRREVAPANRERG